MNHFKGKQFQKDVIIVAVGYYLKNNLYVAECYVCPGPIMKRIMPRAQGRAYRILKRTSHVTIVLKEKE